MNPQRKWIEGIIPGACLVRSYLAGFPLSTNQTVLYQSLSGSTQEVPKPSQCLHSRAPGL